MAGRMVWWMVAIMSWWYDSDDIVFLFLHVRCASEVSEM